jgi:glycosyltransferase involved in cell wall biosynthesis
MRWHIRKPLVVTIHTVVKHSLDRYNLLLAPFDRIFLNHLVIQKADIIINPDLNTQRYVVETFGRRDSVIVPYGITLPQVTDDSTVEYIKNNYYLIGKQVILSLGHVHDIRNREDLIEAMPYILCQVPNAVLLIVGSVSTQEPIQRVKRLGLQNSVIFSDYVPHSQIPAFLELADIEAHWLNQDGMENTSLGIASLEAMWAGKAVLAAANERTYGDGVLKNGENIILVKRGNSRELAEIIVHLLGEKEKRATIGAKARQTIMRHFSWESVCSQTVQAYQEALRKQTLT